MLLVAFGVLALLPAAAQDWPVPPNKGFATVKGLLSARCASCHSWARSYEGIADPKRVIPQDPARSPLFTFLADGSMPPVGKKLTRDEVGLIRAWIGAGAPSTDTPLAAAAPDATGGATPAAEDGTTAATGTAPSASEAGPKRLSPFAMKLRYHEISGFASGGLLLASGIVGGVHFLRMQDEAHRVRDLYDLEEESPACRAAMADAWRGDAALRWVHVGLLSAGELLYLTDAVTGLTMLTPDKPGLTKQDIHRYAFFTHAALMAAEIVMGFITTEALKQGEHELVIGMGVAHTAVGLAIPAVILAAGVLAAALR